MAWTGPTLRFQSVDKQLGSTQEQSGQNADVKETRDLPQTEPRPSNMQHPRCLRSAGKSVILCIYIYIS